MRTPEDDGEAGFTLVELLVTMAVIAGCLLGLIAMQMRAMETTAAAKQRQQATQLANRTMEQIRALPYTTVQMGLSSADLIAPDANLWNVSGVWRFRPTYHPSLDEPLVVSAGQASAPLNPHVQPATSTRVGNTQYDVRAYVTWAGPTAASGYWVTVVATWTPKQNSAPKSVALRSRIYAP